MYVTFHNNGSSFTLRELSAHCNIDLPTLTRLKLNKPKIILVVRSEKLIHAKTHLDKKKIEKDLARPGFEPATFQSEGSCTNLYTMAP